MECNRLKLCRISTICNIHKQAATTVYNPPEKIQDVGLWASKKPARFGQLCPQKYTMEVKTV